MGFPSSGIEASYRNPLNEVQRFFTQFHKKHFKVYNVCSERHYDAQKFENDVCEGLVCHDYVWDDHNPPAMNIIEPMVEDMVAFLNKDTAQNVVAIHCKAGKGRTGMIISCLLLKLGLAESANAALRMFGEKRTQDGKGVTIPSQIRYVHYYSKRLEEGAWREPRKFILKHVRLITVPNFDSAMQGGGCDPYFHIKMRNKAGKVVKVYDWSASKANKVRHVKSKENQADLDCSKEEKPVVLYGDVKFVFYDYDTFSSDDKMCSFWINTTYVDNTYIRLSKRVIDTARKDKKCLHFSSEFEIELYLAVDDSDSVVELVDIGGYDHDEDEDTDEEPSAVNED
eukprot:g1651.t1